MKSYFVLAPLAAIVMAGCTVYRPVAVEPAVVTTPAVAVSPAVVTPPATTIVTPPSTTVLGAPPAGSVIVTPSR